MNDEPKPVETCATYGVGGSLGNDTGTADDHVFCLGCGVEIMFSTHHASSMRTIYTKDGLSPYCGDCANPMAPVPEDEIGDVDHVLNSHSAELADLSNRITHLEHTNEPKPSDDDFPESYNHVPFETVKPKEPAVEERCELCRFWKRSTDAWRASMCRRNPIYEEKASNEWCGEFEAGDKTDA